MELQSRCFSIQLHFSRCRRTSRARYEDCFAKRRFGLTDLISFAFMANIRCTRHLQNHFHTLIGVFQVHNVFQEPLAASSDDWRPPQSAHQTLQTSTMRWLLAILYSFKHNNITWVVESLVIGYYGANYWHHWCTLRHTLCTGIHYGIRVAM